MATFSGTTLALISYASLASASLTWDNQPPKATARALVPVPAAPFRFASSQGDNMVLQMAPSQATVWGYAPEGTAVTVAFQGQSIPATTSMWLGENTWLAKLPATKGSLTEYNITATSGSAKITLANVLFGDVWVCR